MFSTQALLQIFSRANGQPLPLKKIQRDLKVKSYQHAQLYEALKELRQQGKIKEIKRHEYQWQDNPKPRSLSPKKDSVKPTSPPSKRTSPSTSDLISGKLHVTNKGFAFLVPDDDNVPDIFIEAHDTFPALHLDQVLVKITRRRPAEGKEKCEGRVVKVVQRRRSQIVGTLQKTRTAYFIQPDDPKIPLEIFVPAPEVETPIGHKVVVEWKEWRSPQSHPTGIITEVLGPADAPGMDLLCIIKKYDLPEEFPEQVEREVSAIPTHFSADDLAGREDFRSIYTFTIDPDDAKDFDDAISYRFLSNGHLEIGVHIADVSHYVRPGSPLDKEALVRGNSVYLVDRVIPMLPEKLSNGLCSLQPHVDRLVKSVVVEVTPEGDVIKSRFANGIIHSQHRFTYQQALQHLRASQPDELGQHLQRLHPIAQALRRRRFQQGALNLDFPEVKVRLDENKIPIRLERIDNDESHQFIEEFMLLANEIVARETKNRQIPSVYRIHENPDEEKLVEFREQVLAFGIQIGDLTKRGEIQKLLKKIEGKKEEAVIKINLLKSLKRALYSAQPIGHFGLAKANYTHFTSPIRRYADLVVHRALFNPSQKRHLEASTKLNALAEHLSQTERTAAEAEQESVKLKKLEYFSIQAEKDDARVFWALITEVKSFGLMVEIPEFLIQGLVPLSAIEGDFFVFDPRKMELLGRRLNKVIRAGQAIGVRVLRVDWMKRQIDFACPGLNYLKAEMPKTD